MPDGGLAFFGCPPILPLACFLAPIPPTPFPAGRGDQSYFMQGASPLASPRLSRKRHGLNLQNKYPMGGLPFWLPAYPAFSLLFCPLSPRPPSPTGKGEIFSFLMQGASPLASPGLDGARHLQSLPCWHPAQGSLRFRAKPAELLFSEQCRQPRRGGTGGEELRRLRWSSPPGQG